MDSYGVIFDWWPSTPVVHGFNDERLGEKNEDGGSYDYTRCGRIAGSFVNGHLSQPADWIPLKHALKVGRSCRVCFPDNE